MPRALSADADLIAAQYLVEALQNTIQNSPFATTNYIHHEALRTMEELFNTIQNPQNNNQPTDIMDNIRRGKRWQPNQTK